MNKYIRTKNGVYQFNGILYSDGIPAAYCCTNGKNIEIKYAIKEAARIIDLCDQIICYNSPVSYTITNIVKDKRNFNYNINEEWLKQDMLEYYKRDYKVYGAIWTDKGLIYIAKMNEKGELELI